MISGKKKRLACGGTAVNRGPLRLLLEKQSSIWKTMDTLAKTAHWEFFKESHNIWKEARSQRLTFSQGNLGTPHIHDIQTLPFPHTRFSLLKDKPLLFFSWMRWPQHFKMNIDKNVTCASAVGTWLAKPEKWLKIIFYVWTQVMSRFLTQEANRFCTFWFLVTLPPRKEGTLLFKRAQLRHIKATDSFLLGVGLTHLLKEIRFLQNQKMSFETSNPDI